MDEKTAKKHLLELKMRYNRFLKGKVQERMKKEGWNQVKLQERFTVASLEDPATYERWKEQGKKSAQALVECLKQGIKDKVKTV
jgi:hypothetical protein